MGSSIKHSSFSKQDYEDFSMRLQENLQRLSSLLEQPNFGIGKPSLGAELELSIIDQNGQAKWLNQKLIDLADDPQLTLELNQYNLEYNLSPRPASGAPFSAIAQEIRRKLDHLNQLAEPLDARTVTVGILPTLTQKDIGPNSTSDYVRYRVLSESIRQMRGSPFEINIDGRDPLTMTLNNLNAEGANTSFQVHLRVNPEEFTDCYNAAQMASSLALAISTNSPSFLGHRLWEETRIPLFKQAIETRNNGEVTEHLTARTGLGSNWVKNGAIELFQKSVNDFDLLLPECNPNRLSDEGSAPELFELKLHHGTIWHWNRAIYDSAGDGHLRIEMRALPSGPSPIDMAASSAFLVGLTKALSHRMKDYINLIEFDRIKGNFYRTAETGLDAPILWPDENGKLQRLLAYQMIEKLIPLAKEGLQELEVDQAEINAMLGIIEERVEKQITGARWQLQTIQRLEQEMERAPALTTMLQQYLENSDSGKPLHQWSIK